MRIAVLGDFHLDAGNLSLTADAMRDVAEARADLIVALGDFGANSVIGSPAGIDQAAALLREGGARVRPILGNHDLQRETGPGATQAKGTMAKHLAAAFGLTPPLYGVEEYEQVRLFFLCCELQPDDSCYHIQECYTSDEQYEWFASALEERPRVPAIVFSHAPILGSRLRTVPDVHVQATNSYLDHNHKAARWIELVERTADIALWVTAHYHLGHHYPDSIVPYRDLAFVNTGTHGTASRDGRRVSRLLDVADGLISVSTLDHGAGRAESAPDWVWRPRGGARKTEGGTTEALLAAAAPAATYRRKHAVAVGDRAVAASGVAVTGDTAYVADAGGAVWEAALHYGGVLGTLHAGAPIAAVAAGGGAVWIASGGRVRRAKAGDPHRFVRDRRAPADAPAIDVGRPVGALLAGPDALWIAAGRALYAAEPACLAAARPGESVAPRKLGELPCGEGAPAIEELLPAADGALLALAGGRLWRMQAAADGSFEAQPQEPRCVAVGAAAVLAADAAPEAFAALVTDPAGASVVLGLDDAPQRFSPAQSCGPHRIVAVSADEVIVQAGPAIYAFERSSGVSSRLPCPPAASLHPVRGATGRHFAVVVAPEHSETGRWTLEVWSASE